MKKFLTLLMVSFLMVVFTLPAGAVSRTELGAAERERLDTFFSNFAEANVGSFVVNNEIPMDTFVDFGVRHNLINRQYDLVNVNEGYWGVKKEAVEAAVYKYFGRSIRAASSRQYKLTNNLYIVPKGGGEAFTFAQVTDWNESGNGVWTGLANIYTASSGFTGNVHGTTEQWRKEAPEDVPALTGRYMFTVTRSPADADRYVLVDWLGR
ncbi:MAG: hypothetical protein J6W55_02425 [Acidaminococcaceae bacterium]|nr:hypothetical protein [Acidaminococcaceae bacterium]